MAVDLTDFIVAQLTARGIQVRGADSPGPNLMAWCFKGHDRRSPSLSIRKADGMFHCFGCGVKGYDWNALAKLISADELSEENQPDQSSILLDALTRHEQKQNEYTPNQSRDDKLPWDIEPWNEGPYRKLPVKFLRKLDAKLWYDDKVRVYRILLPIYQKGETLGWVSRRLDKKKHMKYRNSDRLPAKQILYPFDFVQRYFRGTDTVVLVEGPFDAIRLCYHRIPALAIMGTNNYDQENSVLLRGAGIRRIIICTDSDDAGKKCRYDTLAPMLTDLFRVEHYFPPTDRDPGDMPMQCVRELRNQVLCSRRANF